MVTVRLFGMTKMLAGNQGALSLALPDGRRVKDLVSVIEAAYPKIGELLHNKKCSFRSIRISRMRILKCVMGMKLFVAAVCRWKCRMLNKPASGVLAFARRLDVLKGTPRLPCALRPLAGQAC